MAWTGDPNNKVPNVAQESIDLSDKRVETNRAEQVRRDTDTQKDYSVKLIDVDTAIFNQLKKFQLSVVDNGSRINVPVNYASPEKWKSIQSDGYMRDYDGNIMLPSIVFHRVESVKDQALANFNPHLIYPTIKSYSQKNRYTPFNLLIGQNAPVKEVYRVMIPDYMVFTYRFIIWTEYIEQMNTLVERLEFESDDYWGDARGFRFRTQADSFSHTTELQVDQDRMVKTEFDLTVYGYLLPERAYDLVSPSPTTGKAFTPKKVIINSEVVATSFNLEQKDTNRKHWSNQNAPNLPADEPIPRPPIVLGDEIVRRKEFETIIETINNAVQNSEYHFPVPTSSSDSGEEGWVSYDSNYYYLYQGGEWKRIPLTSF
jgi:hypothetical protein